MNWLRNVVIGYGLINIAGGVMGLVMGKSVMSLVVGGIAGLVLIGLALATRTQPAFAWRTLGLVTLGLLGFWIYRFNEVSQAGKSTTMPMMNIALAALVMALLAYGHFSKTKGASHPATHS